MGNKSSHHARCSCGQLHLTVKGEPVRVSVCHCLACQRRTGSAFGAQARFLAEQVQVTGNPKEYVRTADSGNRISFSFCPDCGATLFYQLENDPDLIAVPLGAFADPSFASPSVSVYEERQHPWLALKGEIEHID